MSHKSSMYGGGESSDCIVPAKCANKGGEPLAEGMEGRRPAKEIPEHWADAGHRASHSRQLQSFGSACGPRTGRACLFPRWEPCALGARARVCAGGGGQPSSLPRPPRYNRNSETIIFFLLAHLAPLVRTSLMKTKFKSRRSCMQRKAVLVWFGAILSLTTLSNAQSPNASVTGRVTDPSKAVVI